MICGTFIMAVSNRIGGFVRSMLKQPFLNNKNVLWETVKSEYMEDMMKEQLYTIPVNDAFHKDCECPVCEMYRSLEDGAIEFVMGPSYMEDDIRMETNKIGFCSDHLKLMYKNQNRLGLSLMLHTHMENMIKDIEKLSKTGRGSSGGLFKKKDDKSAISGYVNNLKHSCYVCNRIKNIYERYIVTLFYLYKNDADFKKKFQSSKGFCTNHYALLYEKAAENLKGNELEEFTTSLNKIYLENMKRVRDDLEWFTDKFDYRYVNEPWKNSKDALPRAMQKINSVLNIE